MWSHALFKGGCVTIHNIKIFTSFVKPLSQLAHDHFKTLCDPAFWHSHDGSPTLNKLSLVLHAIFCSPAVASDFWACLKFRGDCVRCFLLHWVSRSLVRASYNVVCTRKSGARTFEVLRWFACLDASVVQPWDCYSTCGMWSCNVVLPLHSPESMMAAADEPIPPHRMMRVALKQFTVGYKDEVVQLTS